MNTTLVQNVNNDFYKRRNALTGRAGEITALVEDYADEYLWLAILTAARPGKTFRMTPYQEGKNLSQSKSLIAREIVAKGGDLYIGCLDADQSYLLRGNGNNLGQQLENNRYLFHTYAYSRENLLCYPSSLDLIFSAATSLQTSFNFDAFFKSLSNIIYPVFILDLFMRSINSRVVLNVDKWNNMYPGGRKIKAWLQKNDIASILDDIQKKTNTFVKTLTTAKEYDNEAFLKFEEVLMAANTYVNSDNCFLFVYGHEFLEFVIALMEALKEVELAAEIERINAHATMDAKVKQEKISHLKNEQKEFKTVLSYNAGFVQLNTQIFQLIAADTAVL